MPHSLVRPPRLFSAASVALVASAFATAQTPQVVYDVNQVPTAIRDSNPGAWARLGAQVLFSATTPALGSELFRIDVATGGVTLVTDLRPGTPSSSPFSLVAFGTHVYYFADDGVHGVELWRSDGTAAGTELVIDLTPGGTSLPRDLTVVGNRLFFSAYTAFGYEVVVSDGTAAGTQVLEVNPGGHAFPDSLTAIGNELWFRAQADAAGAEVWRSDGTVAGTVMVADVVPGATGSFPHSFVEVGGQVLFVATGGLWRSDGTAAGTSLLNGSATKLSAANGVAWFTGGGTVWSSDGTVAGTQPRFTFPMPLFSYLDRLVAFGSHVMVSTTGGLPGGSTQHFSDGSQAGTFQSAVPIGNFVVDGAQLWFSGFDGNGAELWRTDGTAAGTTLVADAVPGNGGLAPMNLAVIGVDDVLFSGAAPGFGREPWRSDGTAAGTAMIANLADEIGATNDAFVADVADAAGTAYFGAFDGTSTTLWTTDGTAAGTHPVVPMGADRPSNVTRLTPVGDKLFFIGHTAAYGNEVMVTDGTAAGTHVIDTYWYGDSNPSAMVPAGDRLYFLSYNPVGARSLWQTDGTTTIAISGVIAPGSIGSVGAFGRGCVFGYNNPLLAQGEEPWYTDGTVAGTVILADLFPGLIGSEPGDIVTLGDRCFFTARTQLGYSRNLFVTDGTPAGTHDFFAGHPGAPTTIERLVVVRDQLFFAASDPVNGHELWVSDGTPGGTHVVLDAAPGTNGVTPYSGVPFGDLLLYYMSSPGLTGMWRSDGTAAGTFRICDQVGTGYAAIGERRAWFQGYDPVAGYELWSTDGTVAGTARHADLLPGDAPSQPSEFTLSRGKLLFAAKHEQLGRELWVMDVGATSQPVGYGCAQDGLSLQLWCDDPVLGSTVGFEVRRGPALGLSVPLFTNHVPWHRPLGPGGCDLFLDFDPLVMDVQLFQGGAASHQLAVPVSPALDGLLFRVQVLSLSGGSALELGLSNAVTLALGQY